MICDDNGGIPSCPDGTACVDFQDVLAIGGQSIAGVCVQSCDPLVDNDFLGSGTLGSSCGSGNGCYTNGTLPMAFVCAQELSQTLVHRSALAASDPRVANVCAQGYVPILADDLGDSTLDCIAMCAPGDAYAGNPGTQFPTGQSPHGCNTTDARGTFAGDQCMYSWRFELDGSNFIPSSTSNTVGFCIDHSRYRYDSNGDGMIDTGDATWPDCTMLPLVGSPNAADFGCIAHVLGAPLPARPLDVHLTEFEYR